MNNLSSVSLIVVMGKFRKDLIIDGGLNLSKTWDGCTLKYKIIIIIISSVNLLFFFEINGSFYSLRP